MMLNVECRMLNLGKWFFIAGTPSLRKQEKVL